jgi:hypothetical protein
VVVPAYCRSRDGRMFRVVRVSEPVGTERVRYALRAVPVRQDGQTGHEVSREYDTSLVLASIGLGQTIPTPEQTFEQLWEQLRLDLDVNYG